MAKSNVAKLDGGGYDVEFENGGRVILSAQDASNVTQARKVAKQRLESAGRTVDVDESDSAAEQPTVVDETVDENETVEVDNADRDDDEPERE